MLIFRRIEITFCLNIKISLQTHSRKTRAGGVGGWGAAERLSTVAVLLLCNNRRSSGVLLWGCVCVCVCSKNPPLWLFYPSVRFKRSQQTEWMSGRENVLFAARRTPQNFVQRKKSEGATHLWFAFDDDDCMGKCAVCMYVVCSASEFNSAAISIMKLQMFTVLPNGKMYCKSNCETNWLKG